MIHNTYRRLDEPSLQLGPLSISQWAVIIVLGVLCYVLKQVTGMGTQAILCIATVVIGGLITSTVLTLYLLPLLYSYLSPPDAEEASGPAKEL